MRRRSPLLARVATGVVPLVVAAAGCASDREAASAPPVSEVAIDGRVDPAAATTTPTSDNNVIDVDHVAMVGDSITEGSIVELEDAFASIGFADAEINARGGRKIARNDGITSGLEGVAEVLEEGPDPDLWVIALGTNDVANYPPEEFPALIGELLAVIPADVAVVWVDTYVEDYQEDAVAFDASLREVLAQRGNASIVDWHSIAGEDGVLTDGVHPSGFGRAELARRVTDAVTRWTT